MSTELWLLIAAIVLGVVQLMLQAQSGTMQRGARWNLGPRDGEPPPLTGMAGRLERAWKNFAETFPFFAAAVLIAEAAGVHNGCTYWGAWIYAIGRILYVPLYAFAVTFVRSAVWGVATLGIGTILFGVVEAQF